MITSAQRSARLRQLLAQQCVAMPGAFNALSARMIESAGFSAMYVSGAVLSNSVGGLPDTALMSLDESCDHVRHLAETTTIPMLVDADTGYGGPENCARTVRLLEAAGASGIHLEDQDWPKRCGHLEGKNLIATEDMCEKISAAAAAKTSSDFLLIARTDARSVKGYDEAVRRAHAYLQAGADGIFPEALETREELGRFARDVKTLLLANMTEFGKTELLSVQDLAALGYRMVIFPVTLQRMAMKAVEDALREIKSNGTQRTLLDRMQTRNELYKLLGYTPQTSKRS